MDGFRALMTMFKDRLGFTPVLKSAVSDTVQASNQHQADSGS